jgi:hypothetical protein
MLYAFLAVFLAGLGAGGFAVHQFDAAEIVRLESAIHEGNLKAEKEFEIAQSEIVMAQAKAEKFNQELELSRAQSIQTINALTDRVAAAGRLYARRQNCAGSVSGGDRAGESEEAAEPADFSGRLAEIVRRADETAVYAQSCWRFVSNNCGVN